MPACWAAASSPNFRVRNRLPLFPLPTRGTVRRVTARLGGGGVRSSLESARLAPHYRCPMTTCSRWHTLLSPSHLLALALLAAACSDNPLAPAKPADPLATAANVQALGTSFASPPFESFTFATTYVPTATSPLAALQPLLRAAQPTLVTRRALSP